MTFSANYATSCYGKIAYGIRQASGYAVSLSEAVTSAESTAVFTTFRVATNDVAISGDPLSVSLQIIQPLAAMVAAQETGIGHALLPLKQFGTGDEKREGMIAEDRSGVPDASDRVRAKPNNRI